MTEIVKCLELNLIPPTRSKATLFSEVAEHYLDAVNLCKEAIEFWDGFSEKPMTRWNLHAYCYRSIRQNLPPQLAIDAISDAWANRKDPCARIRQKAVSFNVPRSGNIGKTSRGNPVVRIRLDSKHTAIPIQRDGAWTRFKDHLDNGWRFTHFRISVVDGLWQMVVSFKKDVPMAKTVGTIGVDVGSAVLAAVTVTDAGGAPMRQFYFGQDVAVMQQQILARRSMLQSHADKGSRKARRALDRLGRYEHNFTKTRCYQVAHQVVSLATEYGVSISIEDLKNLRDSRLSKASNRKVKRMPYHEFRAALELVGGQAGIPVNVVSAKNTSRKCPRCGRIDKQNRKGRTFLCVGCGFTVNADRGASLNIARAGLSLERSMISGIVANSRIRIQPSSDGGRVNDPLRNHDGCLSSCSQHAQPPEFKPPYQWVVVDFTTHINGW